MNKLLLSLAGAAIVLGALGSPAYAAVPAPEMSVVDYLPIVQPGYQIHINGDSVTVVMSDRRLATRYSGRIETDGEVVDLRAIQPEVQTHDIVRENNSTVRFSMTTGNYVDGVQFKVVGGSSVKFTLLRNDRLQPVELIRIQGEGHPEANPFTLSLGS